MNNKLKIVLFSKAIYPKENPRANRTTELSKELAKRGHKVTVYSVLGQYDYSNFQKENNLKVKNIGNLIFSQLNSDKNSNRSFFEKVLTKLFFRATNYPDIEFVYRVFKILKREKDIDLLISIAQPHSIHWGVALFKTLHKKENIHCWIADCGDPFMGNEVTKKPFFILDQLKSGFVKILIL